MKGMGRRKIIKSVMITKLVLGSVFGSGQGWRGDGYKTNLVLAHQAAWLWQNEAMTVGSHVACRGMQ